MTHRTDHPESYDRPLADLIRELVGDISLMIRREIALARVEMTEKLTALAKASAWLVVAVFTGLMALGVLTACAILAVAEALPAWLAALIVAVVYVLITGGLVIVGVRRLRKAGKPVPEQTIETLKEDVSWAKQRARSVAT